MKNAIIAAIVSAIVAAGAGSAATLSQVDRNQNQRIRDLARTQVALSREVDELRCDVQYDGADLQACLAAVEATYAYVEQG